MTATRTPSADVGSQSGHEGADRNPASIDVLFVLRSLRPLRYFQSALELLVARGHNVCLLLEQDEHAPAEQAWLDSMLANDNFTCRIVGTIRSDGWHKRGVKLRRAMEYVHFLRPEFRQRRRYVMKALKRSPPPIVRRLAGLPLVRTRIGLRALYGTLSAIERAMPLPAGTKALVEELRPDIVVFGDSGSRASLYGAFARAAKQAGVATATWVASWDNLTTRPRMREVPHRLLVWNETQRREAQLLHEIPPERVHITGAANFDQWFVWPPRPGEEFLSRVGLDPTKPVILWVGSAINHWENPELPFVEQWLEGLRSSSDPALQTAGVLIRPHPLRLSQWSAADFSRYENVSVWPRQEMSMPVATDQKADYYDSIFHSRAVVGINTSAMIEASIIGRPVLTILEPQYHDSQHGALHFSYLLESGGGVLRASPSLEQHYEELSRILAGQQQDIETTARRFVERFVRPRGLDRPATPILVDELESLASETVRPAGEPVWVVPLRALVVAFVRVGTWADTKRRARRLTKGLRRSYQRGRRALAVRAFAVVRRSRRSARRTRRRTVRWSRRALRAPLLVRRLGGRALRRAGLR